MKFSELINEGNWLIKNKDGLQKRFKDAKSQAALDWKNSSSPKKPEKPKTYSQQWWDDKEAAAGYSTDGVYPGDKIDRNDVDDGLVQKLIKSSMTISHSNVTDWHFGRTSTVERDGVDCASIDVNVSLLFTKDDDLGLDNDVEEMDSITIARDPKNPKKLTLA